MRLPAQIKRLLGNLFRRDQLESVLDEELNGYIDEMAARKVRAGMAPAEARRQARMAAGGGGRGGRGGGGSGERGRPARPGSATPSTPPFAMSATPAAPCAALPVSRRWL